MVCNEHLAVGETLLLRPDKLKLIRTASQDKHECLSPLKRVATATLGGPSFEYRPAILPAR